MHFLYMCVSICCYACIVMVKVVVHEAIVFNNVIMMILVCYDAYVLVEIEQEMQIIKVKFPH